MNKLKEIGIVIKIVNDEYTIKLPDRKDLKNDIIKKLAKLELKKRPFDFRKRRVEEQIIKASTLDDF